MIASCLFASLASGQEFESCEQALAQFESRRVGHGSPSTFDFYANSYNNGALLLEFFGPMENTFYEWVHWLESDDDVLQPEGPGVVRYGNGMILVAHGERLATFPNVSRMKGSSEEARAAREQVFSSLELHLFGLYGALKANPRMGALTGHEWDSLSMRTIGQSHLLELATSRHVQYHIRRNLGFSSEEKSKPDDPLEDFNRMVEVVSHEKGAVIVRVKMGDRGRTLNANERLIQKMFFITHWQMVQKAYRETELFQDDVKTALYLIDDFIESMKVSQDQDIYLLYEEEAWKSMLFRMSVAHRYVSIKMSGAGWQPYFYQTINDVFFPFYPMFGLIAEKHPDGVIEMKRLFLNQNPDPLDRLRSSLKRSSLQFHFYHQVARAFPEGNRLMVVSKTNKHTRRYQMVGFKLTDSQWNPEWGSQKDTLHSTREEFMKRTEDKKRDP
jgi:hypothetical protein